jgi:hypothetical protein
MSAIELHLRRAAIALLNEAGKLHPLDLNNATVNIAVSKQLNGSLAFVAEVRTQEDCILLHQLWNPNDEHAFRTAVAAIRSVSEPSIFRPNAVESEATSAVEGTQHKVLQ